MIATRALLLVTVVGSLAMTHCGGDGSGGLGPQIDRMGRAAVNTTVIGPFLDPTGGGARGALQDRYNRDARPSRWVGRHSPEIAGNLAVYDALDGNCGNQLLAGPAPQPGRYETLAEIFADDRLWVNTASGTCQQYLAVELNAIGVTNDDCGGRTPNHDTIDVTYSALAIGDISGVTDGIPEDADGSASLDVFPFYAPPLGG